jgi:tetratricopeptide (TPR) repeat protein
LIYQERSLFHQAIALYRESLSLSEEDGDIRHVMFSYHHLGTASYDLGLFVESKEFHLKALEIATLVGDYSQEDNSEHELGLIDFISGEILSSIRRFRRGIQIARLTGRLEFIPMDLQHIGVAFMEAGKYKAARKFLDRAKEQYVAVRDHSTIPELQSYVVQNCLLDGKTDEAFAAAKVAQRLSSERGIGEFLCRANFMMGLTEYALGDQLAGGAKICDAVSSAQDKSFLALMLDQIYLCARLDVTGLPCPSIIGAARKAVAIYSQLGNSTRPQWTERFVRNLDKNHSTD